MPRTNKSAKVHPLKHAMVWLEWLTGILVSLAVGFALIGDGINQLVLPSWLGGVMASGIVGWVLVIATLIGVIIAIFRK